MRRPPDPAASRPKGTSYVRSIGKNSRKIPGNGLIAWRLEGPRVGQVAKRGLRIDLPDGLQHVCSSRRAWSLSVSSRHFGQRHIGWPSSIQ